jgi:hypothetical protein
MDKGLSSDKRRSTKRFMKPEASLSFPPDPTADFNLFLINRLKPELV